MWKLRSAVWFYICLMPVTLYDILKISPDATADEIKRAYRKLALIYHPDILSHNDESTRLFLEIKDAYETLADPVRRNAYDRKSPLIDPPEDFIHSFTITSDQTEVVCFSELRISFRYTGDGRFFRKPDFKDFFVTGIPFVSFRKVVSGGIEIKETTLTYIVCPLTADLLVIGKASIRIDNKTYFTDELKIRVRDNMCFYCKDHKADGKPYRYPLYYKASSGGEKIRLMRTLSHTVLVPRSYYAMIYHRIGKWLKIVMMIWGIVLCMIIRVHPLIGAIGGLLFGGIMARLLYLIARVKPVFLYSATYPLISEYTLKGYQSGTDPGSRLLQGKWFYYLERLLF